MARKQEKPHSGTAGFCGIQLDWSQEGDAVLARGASKVLFNEGNKLELTEEGCRQTPGQQDTDQLEPGRMAGGGSQAAVTIASVRASPQQQGLRTRQPH